MWQSLLATKWLNTTPSIPVESSSKAIKSKKEESSDGESTDEEMTLVMRNFKKFMKKNFTRRMAMTRRSQIIEDVMSARSWGITLSIALDSRIRKMKRRNTRRRARTLRKDNKVVLMLVKKGSQVMKNPTRKEWHHLPYPRPQDGSSTTFPTMRTTLTFASWQEATR